MRKLFILLIVFAVLFPVFSQEVTAVLEYFDDPAELEITDADGFTVEGIYFGMPISEGETIKTYNSSAELSLDPNGTIIKLAPNTTFSVTTLQKEDGQENSFNIAQGKMRAVAAKVKKGGYRISTPTAVCGVRGTDFGINVVPGQEESLFVREGLVAFSKGGEEIEVGAGQIANALAETFSAVQMSAEQLSQLYSDLDFNVLNPDDVPQAEPAKDEAENNKTEDTSAADTGDMGQQTTANKEETGGAEPQEAAQENPFMEWLRNAVGLEVGSVTIDGQTYSKAILQPVIALGKFKASLYLPIIYTRDMFDLNDWYRPKGNNEWSFGSDYDWGKEPVNGLADFFADLALKIRYIEYGKQRDPFFFKVGNIEGVTTGHGILMNNYTNNTEFPAVRRVGLNLGIDSGKVGTELILNDLAEPEIFGGRLYVRPAAPTFKAAIGLTAIADIDPAGDISSDTTDPVSKAALETDPIFLNLALDLDIPAFETELASLIFFSDVGGMLPFIRNSYGGIQAGFSTSSLVYQKSSTEAELRNYGFTAGLFGNIAIMTYRLEYRYFTGTFKNGFYGPDYERKRAEYAKELVSYLMDSSNPDFHNTTMGIYGNAGFNIADKVTFNAGYFWPWALDSNGNVLTSDEDELNMGLILEKGLVPVPRLEDISAAFYYTRTHFIPTILQKGDFKGTGLFDANTVFRGEIIWAAAPTLDIVTIVTTNIIRNSDGSIAYDDNGAPKWAPSISIESRVHF
ncbi:FecR family protein [Spirochaetia bacterium 38H-sp]|uniref:FecR family protein n=1 Tax=Rarispira pelagica TaxID=3141764 RepID=A0ABU9UBF5_9SPIR